MEHSNDSQLLHEILGFKVVVQITVKPDFSSTQQQGRRRVFTHSVNVGACTGTFADPRVEAEGIISYGLHVRCTGTGFLPLSAKIQLQEEHLGFFYEAVDETFKNLTEGGYGFVRGEAICGPTTSGHDYRISGEIFEDRIMALVSLEKSISRAM